MGKPTSTPIGGTYARLAVGELGRAVESAAWLGESLACAGQYLPSAEALLAEAVRTKKLKPREAQALTVLVLRSAADVQALRGRLARIHSALNALCPPEVAHE